MSRYVSRQHYIDHLKKIAILPEGFRVATHPIRFFPQEKPASDAYLMNLSLILLDNETDAFGGLFTKNAFPGAPVFLCRERMHRATINGIFVNNRIANVCVPRGYNHVEKILYELSRESSKPADSFLVSSTGIIGWKLPVKEIIAALPHLVNSLHTSSILPVAEAIMTTDSFPKVRTVKVGSGKIIGIAKGAGMIEPCMGTLLVFVLTDLKIGREELREQLSWCVERSFNRISVDGDQSTSDMILMLSSQRKAQTEAIVFREALLSICSALAEDVVRNGEGVTHVIRVTVKGCRDSELAHGAGKAILNSPLVKTAIYGNDPNVGRLVSALGDYLGSRGIEINSNTLSIKIGDTLVFTEGVFQLNTLKEETLSRYLKVCSMDPSVKGFPQHEKIVEVEIDMGEGKETATSLGADLSHEYIRENAEYRS